MQKQLTMTVDSEAFGEEFNTKLTEALSGAFGQGTTVQFEDPMMGGAAGGDDKDKIIAGLKAKIAELEGKLNGGTDDKSQEITSLQAKVTELEQQVVEKNKQLSTTSDSLSQYKEQVRLKEIDAIVQDGVKAGKILPVHKDNIHQMLLNADSTKVQKFKKADGSDGERTQFDVVKEYINSLPNMVTFTEISKTGDETTVTTKDTINVRGEILTVVGNDLDTDARAYAQKHNVSYETAVIEVSKAKK